MRKASGESDITRQARQQEVLSGIRDRVVKGGFLDDPVGFLQAMSRTVETNIPRKLVAIPRGVRHGGSTARRPTVRW